MAKRPKRRLVTESSSDNDKRQLREPMPTTAGLCALAARASYAGSGKHKEQPRAFDLEPAASDADDTFCDGHAGFTPEDMARVPALVERGITAGLIGHNDKQGDPTIIWTVDDDGWIYEGRITTPTQAVYHGYPLLPSDAFAKKVIARYTEHVYTPGNTHLLSSLEQAMERYS